MLILIANARPVLLVYNSSHGRAAAKTNIKPHNFEKELDFTIRSFWTQCIMYFIYLVFDLRFVVVQERIRLNKNGVYSEDSANYLDYLSNLNVNAKANTLRFSNIICTIGWLTSKNEIEGGGIGGHSIEFLRVLESEVNNTKRNNSNNNPNTILILRGY